MMIVKLKLSLKKILGAAKTNIETNVLVSKIGLNAAAFLVPGYLKHFFGRNNDVVGNDHKVRDSETEKEGKEREKR